MISVMLLALCLTGCTEENNTLKKYNAENPGEIYFHVTDEKNVIYDEDTGTRYANNEILLVASANASFSDIEKISKSIDAEIKGYIEVTGDYQLIIKEEKTKEQLDEIIVELSQNELVEEASLNTFSSVNPHVKSTNDKRWKNKWSESNPGGENWGMEAIRAPSAWNYNSSMTPVKIGLIDSQFDTKHEDLKFAQTFFNPDFDVKTVDIDGAHGTHVAGIMGAIYNNETGVTGVYPFANGNIYGGSFIGIKKSPWISTYKKKCLLTELIIRDVKVINISMGYESGVVYAATIGENDIRENIKYDSDLMGNFLKRLVDKGYDFVLVTSSGNGSEKKYEKVEISNDYPGGYKEVGVSSSVQCLTEYGSVYNAITEPTVRDRIITVGAVELSTEFTGPFKWEDVYKRAFFSNTGDRLDVMAPGCDITSTVPDNKYKGGEIWSGTSMAAPHVSGVAAMVWSLDNSLTGPEVKEIIKNSATIPVRDSDRNMIDASLALASVSDQCSSVNPSSPKNATVISGVYYNDKKVANAEIKAYKAGSNEVTESCKSNSDGEFELIIPEGKYDITIEADGYLSATEKDIHVLNGQVRYMDWFELKPLVSDFLIPSDIILTIGQIDVIEPDIKPAGASGYTMKWTSSDESVATVSKSGEIGIVQSKSKGTTTITAELTSGDKILKKSTELRVASKGRDTVLVLDISGSMRGDPMNEMKESAIDFCEELLIDEYNNRVGLVCFDDEISTYNLTNDLNALIGIINNISPGGRTNMEGALSQAENMLDSYGNVNSIKNVVIMADGIPNEGATSYSGSSEIVYGYYSEYADAVVDRANSIMSKYNMYSMGYFHSLDAESEQICSQLMCKLTNQTDGYHEVILAENLQFAFGDIADTISDGSKVVINIACPVDVSVTYNGETLSSASRNYRDVSSFGTLQLLGKQRDVKVLSLAIDKVYDIVLEGTDEGKMDYSVNYIDENDGVSDYREFNNVPIKEKTLIKTNTNNTSTMKLDVDLNGDGDIDIVYGAEKNAKAEILEDNTIQTEPVTEIITEPQQESQQNNKDDSLKIIFVLVFAGIIFLGGIVIIVLIAKHKDNNIDASIAINGNDGEGEDEYDKDAIVYERIYFGCPKCGTMVEIHNYRITDKVVCGECHYVISDNNDNLDFVENKEKENVIELSGIIKITSGSMKGFTVPIKDGETIYLGKDSKVSNIVFSKDYAHISRMHCSITFDARTNKYYVVDSSSNGTYFNNKERLIKRKRTPIERSTVLKLANKDCTIFLE